MAGRAPSEDKDSTGFAFSARPALHFKIPAQFQVQIQKNRKLHLHTTARRLTHTCTHSACMTAVRTTTVSHLVSSPGARSTETVIPAPGLARSALRFTDFHGATMRVSSQGPEPPPVGTSVSRTRTSKVRKPTVKCRCGTRQAERASRLTGARGVVAGTGRDAPAGQAAHSRSPTWARHRAITYI